MEYWLYALGVFFVYVTAVFVYRHLTKNDNPVEFFQLLVFCVVGAALWFITVPIIVLIGGAWLTSRVVIMLLKKR